MEEKVMYNVLKAISKGEFGTAQAPDSAYLDSLENIGMIIQGWDNKLTAFGHSILKYLEGKLNPGW